MQPISYVFIQLSKEPRCIVVCILSNLSCKARGARGQFHSFNLWWLMLWLISHYAGVDSSRHILITSLGLVAPTILKPAPTRCHWQHHQQLHSDANVGSTFNLDIFTRRQHRGCQKQHLMAVCLHQREQFWSEIGF